MTEQVNTPELRFPGFNNEWKNLKLNEVLEDKTNGIKRGPFGGALKKEIFVNHGYAVYEQKNAIYDNQSFRYYIDKKKYEQMKLFAVQPGDIIMSCSGTIGKLSKIPKNYKKGIINQALIRFRTNSHIYSQFFLIYMRSNVMQRKILEANPGSAITNLIPVKELKNLKFPLPTLEEQEKIGDFFRKLDQQIELEEKKLELLEQQKRGYMQKIFTQKLRFKDKTGNIYPNWKTTELKDILEKIIDNRGKTPDNAPSEKYPLLEVNALGYYHPSYKKVSKFVSEDTYNNWFREHLKENDILFSTVGNTGIVSLMDNYKAVIAQNIVGLRVNNNNIPSFVYYMLSYWENQKKIKRIQMGAVQPSVKVSQFKFIKYLIPIKDEQEKIANLLSEIDKVINKQLIKIEVLKQRKQGLLQKMFV